MDVMDWACAFAVIAVFGEGLIVHVVRQLREAHRDHLRHKYGECEEDDKE